MKKYSKKFIQSLWNVYISHNPKGTKEKFINRIIKLYKMEEKYLENKRIGKMKLKT